MTANDGLNPDMQTTIGTASRHGVELALHRVAQKLPGDRWLPPSNRYHEECQRYLQADLTRGRIQAQDLAEFIAVSGPVHCLDGWSCIGKAIHCFLKGDPYNAVHLAYYSELRAALSILAAEGIGIFNRIHFVVDDSGAARPIDEHGAPTHQIAWEAFDWWSQQQRAINLLKAVISPSGMDLATWLDAFNKGGVAVVEIGKRWLTQWGMDLKMFDLDRGARNVASYWPTGVDPWELLQAGDALRRLGEFWYPMEPALTSRFNNLDRHFLRSLLESEYRGFSNKQARSIRGRPRFTRLINQMLADLGLAQRGDWGAFLTASVEADQLPLITNASSNSPVGNAGHEVEMISRAILLLRVATGASSLQLQAANLGSKELGFWLELIGTERGIWPKGDQPADFVDLWEDIRIALEEIPETNEDYPPADLQRFEYLDKYPASISKLEEYERVAIWGLGF